MAPPILLDFNTLTQAEPIGGVELVESVNPHRGDMRLLDGIAYADLDAQVFGAWKDIEPDAFWAAGHIPGRPIFPGVLMIEAAAQLSSYICLKQLEDKGFMGFSGVKGAKFRGQVTPGDRLWIVGKQTELKTRRCTCECQGLVNGELVFETTVQGMFF